MIDSAISLGFFFLTMAIIIPTMIDAIIIPTIGPVQSSDWVEGVCTGGQPLFVVEYSRGQLSSLSG